MDKIEVDFLTEEDLVDKNSSSYEIFKKKGRAAKLTDLILTMGIDNEQYSYWTKTARILTEEEREKYNKQLNLVMNSLISSVLPKEELSKLEEDNENNRAKCVDENGRIILFCANYCQMCIRPVINLPDDLFYEILDHAKVDKDDILYIDYFEYPQMAATPKMQKLLDFV